MSEKNKYTLFGALFGFCFPAGSIGILYLTGEVRYTDSLLQIVIDAHQNQLLYVIDTAPFFLGLFARLAGKRQDRIQGFSVSLEKQVADKTESLRLALDEAQRANEMIAHMADHDSLTNLLNRTRLQRTLHEWISHAKRYQRPLALLFLDLDQLKWVNDHYGHHAGDQYLSEVAELLAVTLRDTDVIGRWGGDEFIVVLPEAAMADAQHVANKILSAVNHKTMEFEGERFQPAVSMGIALYPDHAGSEEDLVAKADAAMYEAKKVRGGCWRVYASSPEEVDRVQEHVQWEIRIRKALENDQFVLFHQPLLDLRDGCTNGYEALLRMEDREGQLITPAVFLEAAERHDLTPSLDFMVLRKTLNRIERLHDRQGTLWISMNIARKTLLHEEVVAQLDASLSGSPASASFRLEITEALALEHLTVARELARKLREYDASLILDDFGLGPAPSHYLERLPLKMIKLAPGLVRDLGTPATQSFIKGLVDMAHEMDVEVTAKFVEEPHLLPILRQLGVDYAQGFAIGRPMESLDHAQGGAYGIA